MKILFKSFLVIMLLSQNVSAYGDAGKQSCVERPSRELVSVSVVKIGGKETKYISEISRYVESEAFGEQFICSEVNEAVVKRKVGGSSEIYRMSSRYGLGDEYYITNINYPYLIHYGLPLKVFSDVSVGQRSSFKVTMFGGVAELLISVSVVEKLKVFGAEMMLVRYTVNGVNDVDSRLGKARYVGVGHDYLSAKDGQPLLRFFEIKSYDHKDLEKFSIQYAESSLFKEFL